MVKSMFRLMVACLVMMLAGCTTQHEIVESIDAKGGKLGHAQVLQANHQTLVVIPSADLFHADNPATQTPTKISPKAYALIARLAELIRSEQPTRIEIFAYVGKDVGDSRTAMHVTTERAEHLAAYLWTQGIDSQVLVYRGMGQTGPIASDRTTSGLLFNDRVEVRWYKA